MKTYCIHPLQSRYISLFYVLWHQRCLYPDTCAHRACGSIGLAPAYFATPNERTVGGRLGGAEKARGAKQSRGSNTSGNC